MNRTGLVAGIALAILPGCAFHIPPEKGSGVSKTETRPVTAFSHISVSAAIQLDLDVGPGTSLEVTGDDNLLPFVIVNQVGDNITIYIDRPISTTVGIHVKATTPALKSLHGSGATQSTLTGIEGKSFLLDLSGASTCKLASKAESIQVDISGASQCTLTGEAEKLSIKASGASHVTATDLNATNVDADVNGASTADVRATAELIAKASGASTIRYVGDTEKITNTVTGASTVRKK